MKHLLKRAKGNGQGAAVKKEAGLSLFGREVESAMQRTWKAFGEDLFAPIADFAPWPAVDVKEDEKAVTVRVDVPGLEPKDVDVEVSGNQLTVRGSREEQVKEESEGFRRHERRTGSFARTVTLPPYVDPAKVEAAYDKGVLTVTAPKAPGQGPKKVAVKPAS